jgi:hypothetical protein
MTHALKVLATLGPWLLTVMGAALAIYPPHKRFFRYCWLTAFIVVGLPVAILTARDADELVALQQQTYKK